MVMEKTNEDMEVKIVRVPSFGFLRLKQVLKIIPIGKSTWWAGVKDGRFPPAIKLGARTTVWRAEDIYNLVEKFSNIAEAA